MNLKNYFFRAVMLVAVLFLSVEAYAQAYKFFMLFYSSGMKKHFQIIALFIILMPIKKPQHGQYIFQIHLRR